MAEKKQPPKRRNPYARALAHPLFRARTVPSGKTYTRKGRKERED